MKLSVLIPVYNEEATLSDLLDMVVAAPLPEQVGELEVVAVDDFVGAFASEGRGDVG